MDTLFTSVSTKGQIVIPAELRQALKIKPGTKIAIQRNGDAMVLRAVTDEFIESLCGYFKGGPSLGDIREREHRKDRYE
jgi:AbrB family looped-hinge helix DNA binding protein